MHQKNSAKLIFFCGKMAAGKSTLARNLAVRENAVLLVQDDFLNALFPGEITDIPGFVKYASRLKNALTPHVCALLSKGISVVLDFPGNTKVQRVWFRELIERADVEHELHFIDVSDALCKSQLRERSTELAAGTPWTRDADFEAITAYFQPPSMMKTSMSSGMSAFSTLQVDPIALRLHSVLLITRIPEIRGLNGADSRTKHFAFPEFQTRTKVVKIYTFRAHFRPQRALRASTVPKG